MAERQHKKVRVHGTESYSVTGGGSEVELTSGMVTASAAGVSSRGFPPDVAQKDLGEARSSPEHYRWSQWWPQWPWVHVPG